MTYGYSCTPKYAATSNLASISIRRCPPPCFIRGGITSRNESADKEQSIITIMETTNLSQYAPIPTVREYVHKIVQDHNSGNQFPVALTDVCQLFFSSIENAKLFVEHKFKIEEEFIVNEGQVFLSALCLQELFQLYSDSPNGVTFLQ